MNTKVVCRMALMVACGMACGFAVSCDNSDNWESLTCIDGDRQCEGNHVMVCQNGRYVEESECTGDKPICDPSMTTCVADPNASVPDVPEPNCEVENAFECVDGNLMVCLKGFRTRVKACPEDTVCDADKRSCVNKGLCNTGDKECDLVDGVAVVKVCGEDGQWSIGEICHDEQICSTQSKTCEDKPPVATCGDGTIDGNEECDGDTLPVGATCTSVMNDGKAYTGELSCAACKLVTENCVAVEEDKPVAVCGDGTIDGNEECDGDTLPVGATCTSAMNDGKVYTGELSCVACKLVTENCVAVEEDKPVAVCGDKTINGDEECDGNTLPVGATCTSVMNDGKAYTGKLSCAACKLVTKNCVAEPQPIVKCVDYFEDKIEVEAYGCHTQTSFAVCLEAGILDENNVQECPTMTNAEAKCTQGVCSLDCEPGYAMDLTGAEPQCTKTLYCNGLKAIAYNEDTKAWVEEDCSAKAPEHATASCDVGICGWSCNVTETDNENVEHRYIQGKDDQNNDVCLEVICEAGTELRCDPEQEGMIQICNETGTGWELHDNCSTKTMPANAKGICKESACDWVCKDEEEDNDGVIHLYYQSIDDQNESICVETLWKSISVPTPDTDGLLNETQEVRAYCLRNVDDLDALRVSVSNGKRMPDVESTSVAYNQDNAYVLMADVDFGEDEIIWESIGTNDHPFSGIFSGDEHTVSGTIKYKLSNDPSATRPPYSGLFGKADGATIFDLVSHLNVTGYNSVGGVVGSAYNSYFKNITYQGTIKEGYNSIGGIIGFSKNNVLMDIEASGSIADETSSINVAGMIIGNMHDSKLVSCSVHDATLYGSSVGGITSYVGRSTVENCTLTDVFISQKTSDQNLYGFVSATSDGEQDAYSMIKNIEIQDSELICGQNCGGLVGIANNTSAIDCTVSDSTIVSNDWRVGGLFGRSKHVNVTGCSHDGSVTGEQEVGGIVGKAESSAFDHVTHTGNVDLTEGSVYDEIGLFSGNADSDTSFTQCHASGKVRGTATTWQSDDYTP